MTDVLVLEGRVSAFQENLRAATLLLHGKHNQKSHGFRKKAIATPSAAQTASDQWYDGLSGSEMDSLDLWTGGQMSMINAALTGKLDSSKAMATGVVSTIGTAPTYTGTMHRGMSFDTTEQRDQFVRQVRDSKGLTNNGLQSFTTSREVADNFGQTGTQQSGVSLKVKSKTGRAIMGHDTEKVFDEAEVVSMPGTRYKMTGVRNVTRGGETRPEISFEEE